MSDTKLVPWSNTEIEVPVDVQKKYAELAQRMAGNADAFEGGGRDWRPPILKIVQPVTTDAAKPDTAKTGDFFTKGGAVKKPLRGVLAYAWHSRVRFVQGVDKTPSCRSENTDPKGRGAKDTSISVYGDKCAECPYGDQPFTGGKQTNCNNVLNVIFISETLDDVYHLQFSKSNYSIGRQLTDLARATPKAWSRFYDLNTETKKREKGTGLYSVYTVTPVSGAPVPEHLTAFAEYVMNQMKGIREADKSKVVERVNAADARAASLDTLAAEKTYKDSI